MPADATGSRPTRRTAAERDGIERHLLAMARAHFGGRADEVYVVTLQCAAEEERRGNVRLARQLRDLADKAKRDASLFGGRPATPLAPFAQPRGEVADLLIATYPDVGLDRLALAPALRARLDRVLREQREAALLRAHGLGPRGKLLLAGPPGTGKTTAASALAAELRLPLFSVRLDGLITKFLGETAQKLRMIFDAMPACPGVYFWDEFDAIGGKRGAPNEVGEMRRVLNAFLQMIEKDQSGCLIVVATNHADLLDYALFRRFDDVLPFDLPTRDHLAAVVRARLGDFKVDVDWDRAAEAIGPLSQSDIASAAHDAAKDAVLAGRDSVGTDALIACLESRKDGHPSKL